MKKSLVEIGTYSICRKGRTAYTLAAPRMWMKFAGVNLGDECIAVIDKRDNSLHFYPKSSITQYP